MTISVNGVSALTTKAIESSGGVRDAIFKKDPYLRRLKSKQKAWAGEKLTIPFAYKDDTESNGKFYQGAATLSQDMYDPITELEFELIEIVETLVLTRRDLAKNDSKHGIIKLLAARSKHMEQAMRQRFMKGIYSDGSASTGALTTDQFLGVRKFLKSSSVDYAGITDTDVSTHAAYVNANSGTNRALTTALDQDVIGGASEGDEAPTLRIMEQGVMDKFIELLKPHQRTTRESSLAGLGHKGNTLVYSGIDSIVCNLAPSNSILYINENHVHLYTHPSYDMKSAKWDNLETMDAIMRRLFWKGAYAAGVLRFQGKLEDITT